MSKPNTSKRLSYSEAGALTFVLGSVVFVIAGIVTNVTGSKLTTLANTEIWACVAAGLWTCLLIPYRVTHRWSDTTEEAFAYAMLIFIPGFSIYMAMLTASHPEADSGFLMWCRLMVVTLLAPVVIGVIGDFLHWAMKVVLWPVWVAMGKPNSTVFLAATTAPLALSNRRAETSEQIAEVKRDVVPLPPAAEPESASKPKYEFDWKKPKTNFASLAGMSTLKGELNQAIAPFRAYASNGAVADRNGIILSGPPGNGKTTFAMAIAGELGLPYVKVSGVDVTSMWLNESPSMLKELFAQAARQPCVVFIDELDSILKSRGGANVHEEDKKLVTAFLTLVDEARSHRIVLVAATNYLDQLDKAGIRDGRFDYRIEVPYPDSEARQAILAGLIAKHGLTVEPAVVKHVASLWERRSIAFIESTVKRLRDSGKGTNGTSASIAEFKQASQDASRRAGNIPASGDCVSELALPASVRREVDSLIYRLTNWEKIAEQGGEPPSGVLLYGPPGTGKTNLVRAIARELKVWHVFEVNATDVISDPRKFKETVELAADHRPAIVFIDEADELLRNRNYSANTGATNEILKSMDGMMGKVPEVVFIAATNNPDVIDAAALRGGRFAEKIFMGRLAGNDLVVFLEKEFAKRKNAAFAPELTPQALTEKLGQAAPADAITVLRKAINYTFSPDAAARAVTLADIDAAIAATRT